MWPDIPINVSEKWVPQTWGDRFHFPNETVDGPTWKDVPPPSTCAATVFSALGIGLDFDLDRRSDFVSSDPEHTSISSDLIRKAIAEAW
jgi:hypothetical protein